MGFTDIETAMQAVMERAQAMSKKYETSSSQTETLNVECKSCNDTGMLFEIVQEELTLKNQEPRMVWKDVGRPCHCLKEKSLKSRFKNALIPDEFKNARFDNYVLENEAQKTL